LILPLYDHPACVAGLYRFQRIFLAPRTIRAGEGFLLAEERVIRRPVLITQTFTSGITHAQLMCPDADRGRNEPPNPLQSS
jgi:hypothetical protein